MHSIKTAAMEDGHGHVEVQSILRLRPMLKKEREETILLEVQKNTSRNAPPTVVLNPPRISLASPTAGHPRARSESDGTIHNTPIDFHFNHVLPETASQDKVYYTLGLPTATEAMSSLTRNSSNRPQEPNKNHLFVSMGITNSGKTYTCFGGTNIPKRRALQDGLVPRLVDSLFSQSKHHVNADSRDFSVHISMVQVSQSKGNDPKNCKIYDLFGITEKKKAPSQTIKSVRSMAAKFEKALPSVASPMRSTLAKSSDFVELDAEEPLPSVEKCFEVSQARETLQNGLDASRKAGKGNQSNHLLVVLQPFLNGSECGDKIVVLDMAGLEKAKRNQSRQKDVVGMNEAANGAVLNCLRTMIHNMNITTGKRRAIDVADDTASEISCVSQEKDPYQQSMKTVPFRQHKVTMLLHPLFRNEQMTKVTLVMAAYPGNSDYVEKKSLLQDMELLCGSSLFAAGARVSTGLERTLRQDHSTFTDTESEYGDDSTLPLAKENIARLGHTEKSVHIPSFDHEEGDMRSTTRPPAFAPSYRGSSPLGGIRQNNDDFRSAAPDAGKLPPISDFPGVSMPHNIDKSPNLIHQTMPVSMVGGPKSNSPAYSSRNDERTFQETIYQGDYLDEKRSPLTSLDNSKGRDKRVPSSTKQTEASPQKTSMKPRKVHTVALQERVVVKEHRQKSRRSSQPESARIDSSSKGNGSRQSTGGDKEMRIKQAESKMRQLLHEKQAIDDKNKELARENRELRSMLQQVGRSKRSWSNKDEEEFQENRKLRLEDQTLVKAPLYAHLKKVDYIYDIKNQWAMSDKPQFNLLFPAHFQRAPDLDTRDKIIEEREAAIMERQATSSSANRKERRSLLRRSGLFPRRL
ncbi:unnamed protein product [Cylindrotheca closterium]|uniref:Kinesin motor domain-containing protein n=1 Tax=Cylindrotheca closterium TaxID=2856 RepID=A0AAD2JJ23_9STRA|nr:unnamed protein product [Cylindrotheca closterium]